jgi:hypothetical protein
MANNDKESKLSSNTYGYTSKNYQSLTAISVNYFNRMGSITIALPIEGAKGDFTQFDYEKGVKAYLSPKDCKLVAKMGRKALKKIDETGSFEGFAIPLKRGAFEIVQVSELRGKMNAVSGDANPNDIAVVIYTDMDDSKKTDKFLIHIFNEDMVIKGYKASTGAHTREVINVEFEYFIDSLEDFAIAMSNGQVHAAKDDGKFSRTKWERNMMELAATLGVDFSKGSSSGGNKGKAPSGWNSNSSNESERYAGGKDSNQYNSEIIDTSEEEVNELIESMKH